MPNTSFTHSAPIRLTELEGFPRVDEPIALGVPLIKGAHVPGAPIRLVDPNRTPIPAQFTPLGRWEDGSTKWMLTQWLASLSPNQERTYTVEYGGQTSETGDGRRETGDKPQASSLKPQNWTLKTDTGALTLDPDIPGGFHSYVPKGAPQGIQVGDAGLVFGTVDDRRFHQAPPDAIRILEHGPVRFVVEIKGAFEDEQGNLDLRYTTLFYLYANRPELRWTQFFHVAGETGTVTLSELFATLSVSLRSNVPVLCKGSREADAHRSRLNPNDTVSLRTKEDLSYVWTGPDGVEETGERAAGWMAYETPSGAAGIALRDFWQRSPAGLILNGDGRLHIQFWPGAPQEPVPLTRGTSFRHEIVLSFGEDQERVIESLRAFQHPIHWAIDPDVLCRTRALGYLSPADPNRCPGFENGVAQGLDRLFEEREHDVHYFGLLNYGDWPMKIGAYGSTWRMYADNEYDVPHVLYLLFARSGRPDYFNAARAGAIHMTDVDVHGDTGGMFFHGYRESAEDHRAHRGHPGEWGHVWADGILDHYFLTGDHTALEAAQRLGDFCLQGFEGEGHEPIRRIFVGCERAVGWPMITLAALSQATGDPRYLHKIRQMVEYLHHFVQDPDAEIEVDPLGRGGHWWRILMQDGCKPFMVGVLYEGLKRYHQITGDEHVVEVFRKSLDWLLDNMWYPLRGAFMYEFNAFNQGHRDVFPHSINLLVVDGLAYAYRLTGDPRYLEVGLQAFYGALWTLPDLIGGKELGMACRSSLDFVALLSELQQSEVVAPAGVLEGLSVPDEPSTPEPWPSLEPLPPRRLFAASFRQDTRPEQATGAPTPHVGTGPIQLERGGLHAVRGSTCTFEVQGNVSPIAGTCRFRFRPDWPGDAQGRPYPRALIHIQSQPFTKDALSLIAFYNGLHLRCYGPDRRLTAVLETDIGAWNAGEEHAIAFTWEPGHVQLFVDSDLKAEAPLRRPFSGPFDLIRIGHRPGFWFADGVIRDLEIWDQPCSNGIFFHRGERGDR